MTQTIHDEVRLWLFEDALPFWSAHGVDRQNGGFVEQLRLGGSNPHVDFKRVRVMARQTYVFSHAALLGWKPGVELAHHGFDFLTRKAWQGPDLGWARRLDANGAVKDPAHDLYDIAFVLFALGWYHRLTKDDEALAWIHRTLDFVDAKMRHPGGIGFINASDATGPRLQNPHMHLLEAALIALENTGEPRFRALSDEIVTLFIDRFFNPETHTLTEFFDDNLRPAPGDIGRLVEPGHHFEWAWLLGLYQRLTGVDIGWHARELVDFAERHGVRDGATVNMVRDDGTLLDASIRIWPNAERIQAAVAMFELDGKDPLPVFEQSGRLLLDRFLAVRPSGFWIEQFNAEGRPDTDKIPASTLYHLFIAFSEMLRIEAL